MDKFFIAPGNAGTDIFGTSLAIKPTDFEAVYAAVCEHDINLVVAGNEDPLVQGLREALSAKAQTDGRELLIVRPPAPTALPSKARKISPKTSWGATAYQPRATSQ